MKFPLPSYKMPLDSMLSASLQSWLGHELEMRGIDAVIYTRYILSILQQDHLEVDIGEAEFFPPGKKGLLSPAFVASSIPNQGPVKLGQKGKRQEKRKCFVLSQDACTYAEQRKKSAAIECLLSVSDEDSGIESLVDELYLKLKAQGSTDKTEPVTEAAVDPDSSDSVISTSPEDPAERYYAAFPALCDGGEAQASGTTTSSTPAWPKASLGGPNSGDDKEHETEANTDLQTNKISPSRKDSRGPKQPRYKRSPSSQPRDDQVSHGNSRKLTPRGGYASQGYGLAVESIQGRVLSWDDSYSRQDQHYDNKQFFRSGSQERVLRKSPKMSRKKSWPDFEKYPQPSFIVPKMPTQSKPQNMTYFCGADSTGKETVSPGKISLQEIFGTEHVSEIVPCKTLVVDGQLVRLCATSVNSNNLDKTAKVKFKEAPMEELVAMKLQQEVEDSKKSVHVAFDEMADLTEEYEAEDSTWYTDPLNNLMPKSPQPKAPLFRRNPSEQSFSEPNDSENDLTVSMATTPTFTTLWEDVLDEDGVYVGARLQSIHDSGISPHGAIKKDTETEYSKSSETPDYVDMTIASYLLCGLFDDLTEEEDHQSDGTLQHSKEDIKSNTSNDRLDIFKVLAQEDEDCATPCSCGAACSDVNRSDNFVPPYVEAEQFISQYKGCLMPEITQNKVPDDRPMFFLDEQELNNNNNSEHTKVTSYGLWSDVDRGSNSIILPNLFPSLHTSLSSPSSVLLPGYSSIWSTQNNATTLEKEYDMFNKGPSPRSLLARGCPEMQTTNLFNITSSATFLHGACLSDWPKDASLSSWSHGVSIPSCSPSNRAMSCWSVTMPTISMLCTPASLVDTIWGEPLLASPPKIWDINNSRKLEAESPRERSNTLENINKYMLSISLNQAQHNKSDVEFIEGGLYGGPLNSDDAWSTTRSDCSEDEGICDSDTMWNDSFVYKAHMYQSHSADDFQSSMFQDEVCEDWKLSVWSNKLTGSMELLQSETSAFSSDALPSRLPHLPHVQSEPSMSHSQPKWNNGKHRLVEVKHLYKPDTSILKTLGLDSDVEEEDPEGVEFSSDRHFKPIKTPLSHLATGGHVQCLADVYLYNYCVPVGCSKKEDDDETLTLTDNYSYVADCLEELSMMSSSDGSANYQLYHGEETIDVTFIPRFKVFKEHKLIQTGELEPGAEEMEQGLSERLLDDMKRVLTVEEEETENDCNSNITMKDLDRSLETQEGAASQAIENTTEEASWSTALIKSALSSPTPQAIANLWGDDATMNASNVWGDDASMNASNVWGDDASMNASNVWGDDASMNASDLSSIQDPMTNSTSSIWGYEATTQQAAADYSFVNLYPSNNMHNDFRDEQSTSMDNPLCQPPIDCKIDNQTLVDPKWPMETKIENKYPPKNTNISGELEAAMMSHAGAENAEAMYQPEHYIPDVLMEVCTPSVSSHGMTPGSLPDILMHDFITADNNLNSPNVKPDSLSDHTPVVTKDDKSVHGSSNNHPVTLSCNFEGKQTNTAGIFNLDLSSFSQVNSSSVLAGLGGPDEHMEHHYGENVGELGPGKDYMKGCGVYGGGTGEYHSWSLAESDLHIQDKDDSAEELVPEWLLDDDDVFTDSDNMIFAMDPDVHLKKTRSNNSTATLTNYFKSLPKSELASPENLSISNFFKPIQHADSSSPLSTTLTSQYQTGIVCQSEVPGPQVVYSTDLESSWMEDDEHFSVQVPHRTQKNRIGSGRKPCTYFMEGNCRRTDCRFAHDTSQITCRFWEEGDCFKGITCPFLHGYPSPTKKRRESAGQKANFSLEHDEFPELTKNGSKVDSSMLAEICTDRPVAVNKAHSTDSKKKSPCNKLSLSGNTSTPGNTSSPGNTSTPSNTNTPGNSSTYTKYKHLRSKFKHKAKSLPIDVVCKNKR